MRRMMITSFRRFLDGYLNLNELLLSHSKCMEPKKQNHTHGAATTTDSATSLSSYFLRPTLVAGTLLLIIGVGLFIANQSRITNFTKDYNTDVSAFVQSEIERADKTVKEYQRIVFKVIPIIIVVAALLIMFIDTPMWRAISITTIGMMVVILLVDSNAKTRIEDYHKQLLLVEKDFKK